MELLQYWRVIRKSLWLILLILLVGIGGVAAYTLNKPVQYESSSTLLLIPSGSRDLWQPVQTQIAGSLADSYGELIRTRAFADEVVKSLSFPLAADKMALHVETLLVPDTLFFKVSAIMDTPEQAQQLVTAVTRVLETTIAAQQQAPTTGTTATDPARQQMLSQLQSKLKYLSDQISGFQTQIAALEKQTPTTQRDDRLLQLRNELLSYQDSETNTMRAIVELSDTKTSADNSFVVIDQPLPGKPVDRHLLSNVSLAFTVALLLGLAIAFLRDYLDYTVRSPEHLRQVMNLAPVASIGRMGSMEGATGRNLPWPFRRRDDSAWAHALTSQDLVTLLAPRSPASESFRVLRTNLQFTGLEKPLRNLLVTSTRAGEGKSFTAANLAVVMAQAGKRVLLVDADLRKPSIHKVFNLTNNAGFTNLLLNRATASEGAIRAAPGVENLAVITSGPLPPNPSEVLNSTNAAQVVTQLARMADVVIYDAPPAGVVADAAIIATRMDGVLLVIAAGSTRRDSITRVIESLHNVGVTNILPVLNRVEDKALHGDYKYYSEVDEEMESDLMVEAAPGYGPAFGQPTSAGTAPSLPGRGTSQNS